MPTSFFGWVGFLLEKYGSLFLNGTGTTMLIAVSGTVLGFGLGLLVAVARGIRPTPVPRAALAPLRDYFSRATPKLLKGFPFRALLCLLKSLLSRASLPLLKGFLNVYIEVFRGTPMLVQAMVIYYGLQQFAGISMDQLVAGVFVVSINTGAYMAEIVRGGILSVDVGQTEAAHSIGMSHWQTMTSVVLPQAIRNIMPSIGNEFIVNIKDSCVLNVIAVSELFFMSKKAAGTYLRYFEVFFITGIIYLILTFTVSRLLRLLERRMDGPAHYTIHGSQSASGAAIATFKQGGGKEG